MSPNADDFLLSCITPGQSPSKPTEQDESTFRIVTLVDGFGRPYRKSIPSNPRHRQEGRTMLQMLDAPQGALFVWPASYTLPYPKNMQKALQREDLRVVTAHQFAQPGFADQNTRQVVIDHGVWMLNEPWQGMLSAAIEISVHRGLFKWTD